MKEKIKKDYEYKLVNAVNFCVMFRLMRTMSSLINFREISIKSRFDGATGRGGGVRDGV